MTIILFLIDTNFAMNQKTISGITYLDVAKNFIEIFLKMRAKDPFFRGDRYMLLTTECYPKNIKAGWRESHVVFLQELKNIKANYNNDINNAFSQAFELLNINRLMSGIDTFGQGRNPFYIEYSIILFLSDGAFMVNQDLILDKPIISSMPALFGSELINQMFRWDQKLYSCIIDISENFNSNNFAINQQLKYKQLSTFCETTGGNNYVLSSQTGITPYIEWLLQKIQLPRITLKFTTPLNYSLDSIFPTKTESFLKPNYQALQVSNQEMTDNSKKLSTTTTNTVIPPSFMFDFKKFGDGSLGDIDMRKSESTMILDNISNIPSLKFDIENPLPSPETSTPMSPTNQSAEETFTANIFVMGKHTHNTYFWPLPEIYQIENVQDDHLPPRDSIPRLTLHKTSRPFNEHCEITSKCPPNFPVDRYDFEGANPFTQYLMHYFTTHIDPNILDITLIPNCLQVQAPMQANNSKNIHEGGIIDYIPIGYIKCNIIQSTGVLESTQPSLNFGPFTLCLLPYRFNVLLNMFDHYLNILHSKIDMDWKMKFDLYIENMPPYYIQPFKKALQKVNLLYLFPENVKDSSGLNYQLTTYLKKIKSQAKVDFDKMIATLNHLTLNKQQQFQPPGLVKGVNENTPHISDKSVTIDNARKLIQIPLTISLSLLNLIMIENAQNSSLLDKILARPAFNNEFKHKQSLNMEKLMKERNYRDNISIYPPNSKKRRKETLNINQRRDELFETCLHLKRKILNTPWAKINFSQHTTLMLNKNASIHKKHEKEFEVPIAQMGNYQEYASKKSEEIPLRPVHNTSTFVRQHLFGNPFKVDKRMMVDETDNEIWATTPSVNNTAAQGNTKTINKRIQVGPLPSDYKYIPQYLRVTDTSSGVEKLTVKPLIAGHLRGVEEDKIDDDTPMTDINIDLPTEDIVEPKVFDEDNVTDIPQGSTEDESFYTDTNSFFQAPADILETKNEPFDEKLMIGDLNYHEPSSSEHQPDQNIMEPLNFPKELPENVLECFDDRQAFISILFDCTRDVYPLADLARHFSHLNHESNNNSNICDVNNEITKWFIGKEFSSRDVFTKNQLIRLKTLTRSLYKSIRNDDNDSTIVKELLQSETNDFVYLYLLRDVIRHCVSFQRVSLKRSLIAILRKKIQHVLAISEHAYNV